MLRLGGERDTLSVVADQIGSPTLAGDLAEAIVATLKPVREGNCAWGLYHYAGDTSVSWHEFACEIFAQAKHMGVLGAGCCECHFHQRVSHGGPKTCLVSAR